VEIILIAAVDRNLAIGKNGKIPWDIKEDLNFFRKKLKIVQLLWAEPLLIL
jgi:dihydrofolate reductase